MIKKISILILCMCMLAVTACAPYGEFLTSITEITLYDGNIEAAEKEISQFLEDFEQKTSVNVKNSDVSKINNAKDNVETEVSPYVIDMINISKAVYNETEGAFNPCIYPILKLYNSNKKTIPDNETIEELLPYININDLTVKGNSIIKKYSEMQIDFGAIAKGYAADKCVEIAKKHGVTSGVIDIGSNLYIMGAKSGSILDENYTPFKVGITNPRQEDGGLYFGKIDLVEISAVTSGDYVRYFILDNIRYCHIIDGKTGKRPDSNLISVTLFGENSALCDAYSTALFVMGMEKAIKFSEENLKDFKVLLINENKEYYKTSGLNIYDIESSYKVYG